MLKTAHDAEEFMRTGARVSPSWPGGDTARPDTLKQTDQPPISTKPLADGAGHTFSRSHTNKFERNKDRELHAFFTQSAHHPFGEMSPATDLQAFGATKRLHPSHCLPSLGVG